MDIKTVILIFALLPNIILGSLSYLKGRRTKANYAWTILIWAIVFWIISMIFYRMAGSQYIVFWCRVLYAMASLIPITFLFFSFLFPKDKWPPKKWLIYLLLLPVPIIIFLVIYPNAIIKNVIIRPGEESEIIWGPFYIIYAIYFSFYFSWSLWNIFKKYRKSAGVIKNQLRYILVGTGISSALGVIFNLFLPWIGQFGLNWLGQVTTLFMIAAVTYAIYRFNFMDIRVILTEFLIASIAIVLLTDVFLAKTQNQQLFRGLIFLIFCFFGYLLIKSVLNEIKRREELEKLTKAKSEFISIASHQLRTPLTAIKGYASLMLEKSYGALPPKIKTPTQNIYSSSERLLKLVSNLLNISRIEAGKIETDFRKISLGNIIDSVIEELGIEAKEKNIYLEYKKSPEYSSEITGDEEKLRQVILNIIDNAIRYTNQGGIAVETAAIQLFGKPAIQIAIRDTGEGMAKEEMETLFESFSRGKTGNKLWTEGTGLGLYVAKKFVEIHNGRIWVESRGKGQGSVFYIELPIK